MTDWIRKLGDGWHTLAALGLAAALVSSVGCGPPAPVVKRILYVPPLPENCPIEVVNVDMSVLGPSSSTYDFLGTIDLHDRDSGGDPFDQRRLDILIPEACKLGGEKITLGVAVRGTGFTQTAYSVIRAKGGATTPPPP